MGAESCDGMENAYNPERSPARWHHLSPAYFVSAQPWFYGKLERILMSDAMRAVAPLVVIVAVVLGQTRNLLLAGFAVLILCFALCLAMLFFWLLPGGTWLSVYAYPSLYITVGIGVNDVFLMTHAWMLSTEHDASARLAETYRVSLHPDEY